MRILIVNQFFYPDVSAVAQQLTDLAEDLTAAGDQVTVICGQGAYEPGTPAPAAREVYQGIQIRRVRSTGVGRARSLAARLVDLFSFYALSFWDMLRAPRPGLIYVISTPPLLCVPALVAGWLRRLPVVYGIHDLHPDIAVALGVLSPRAWSTRLLDALSMAAMKRVRRLIVLGRFAKQHLERKGIPGGRIVVLENWADPAQIRPVPREENWFRRQHGFEGKFVVLYSGNMGLAHEFATLLEAARRLAAHPDIVFLFVGGGARQREVEEFRDRYQLPNIRLAGYQGRGDLSHSLSSGDAFLVTLRPGCEGLVLPCKVYAGMAVARPILFVGSTENDTAEAILQSGSGWVFSPGDAAGLAAKILELKENPVLGEERGRRGRKALEGHNYRGHATEGYRRVFAEALAARGEESAGCV